MESLGSAEANGVRLHGMTARAATRSGGAAAGSTGRGGASPAAFEHMAREFCTLSV